MNKMTEIGELREGKVFITGKASKPIFMVTSNCHIGFKNKATICIENEERPDHIGNMFFFDIEKKVIPIEIKITKRK